MNKLENFIFFNLLLFFFGLNLIGGGLLIVFRFDVNLCSVLVEDLFFDCNYVMFGGGLYYVFI